MGKGGAKTESKLPGWYADWSKRMLADSNRVAQQGYTPYQGPDVAAFNPQQMQGMQMANNWAGAFDGNPNNATPQVASQIPKPQTFAGGIQGYSSFPGYQQEMTKLNKRFPGLYKYIMSFGVNKKTGAPATGFAADILNPIPVTQPVTGSTTPTRDRHDTRN